MENVARVQPRYMFVWGVLAALMVTKVFIAFLGLPKTVTVVLLCLVALWKAALVAMYYMHLRYEPTRLVLVTLVPLPLAVLLVVAVLLDRF